MTVPTSEGVPALRAYRAAGVDWPGSRTKFTLPEVDPVRRNPPITKKRKPDMRKDENKIGKREKEKGKTGQADPRVYQQTQEYHASLCK